MKSAFFSSEGQGWRHARSWMAGILMMLAMGMFNLAHAFLSPTTTTLTFNPNPAYVGQSVTITATVTGNTPSGLVTFFHGLLPIGTAVLNNGTASITKGPYSSAGNHAFKAVYAGNLGSLPSSSGFVTLNVKNKIASVATLTSSSPPIYPGQPVTLSVAVSGTNPTGSVTFKSGASTILGTAPVLNGLATLQTSFANAGAYSLSASYSGDAAHNGDDSNILSLTVQAKAAVAITLVTTPSTSELNGVVMLTADLSGNVPTGSVIFMDGGNALGASPIANGQATLTTSFASLGQHALSASYAGDVANQPATSSVIQHAVNKVTSSISLNAAPNPAQVGQPVTLSAAVSGYVPGGTVTFMEGGNVLGSVAVTDGAATWAATFTSAGSQQLSATYSGDDANTPSQSAPLTQVIELNTSNTTLTASSTAVTARDVVTLTVTVGGPAPTGTVTFFDGATVLGTATLVNGQASFSATFETIGTHTLKAVYSGDVGHTASESGIASVTVAAASSATTLIASNTSVSIDQELTLTATVTGLSPSGSVSFVDGTTPLGTAVLVDGQASLSISFDSAGTRTLLANYDGDAVNEPSVSSAFIVEVQGQTGGSGPGNMTWLYGYDALGNRTNVTNPNGHQTLTAYDALSRVFTITLPAPQPGASAPQAGLRYDGLDQVIKVIDPRSLETNYTLDGLGRQGALASPDTGLTSSTYDAAGRLLTRTDARGKTTTYAYDALSRVISISYTSGTATAFEYDGGANPTPTDVGQLTKMADESGWTTFAYDAFGNLLSKTQHVVTPGGTRTLQVGYEWGATGSANGKLTAITYPSGMRVNYGYDMAGRLSTVSVDPVNLNGVGTSSGATVPLLHGMAYNGANDLLGWTWGNGSSYARSYDEHGRLTSYPLGDPSGTGAAEGVVRTVVYDNAGRITAYTHANDTGPQNQLNQQFIYDDQDRLKSMSMYGTSYGYSYDANGNRTARRIGSVTYANTVDANSNRLTSVQMPSGNGALPVVQIYDASGNLIDGGSGTSTYSDRGRLSQVTVAGGSVSYLYNGREQRVFKMGPTSLLASGAVYYVYDEEGQVLGEYDANLLPLSETVYAGSLPVAVARQERGGEVVQTRLAHVYADQLGAPRVLARNTDNAIVWRWDNAEAFGATPPDQNPSGLGLFIFNQRFPGQIFDSESGKFYNWHRDYHSAVGRYLQSDPIGLDGGINTYTYASGNPLSYIDPDGRASMWVIIPVGLLVYKVGSEAWKFYKLEQCVKGCAIQCDEGDTRPNLLCKHACFFKVYGKSGSPGARWPTSK